MSTIPIHLQTYWEAFLRFSVADDLADVRFYDAFRIGADEHDANEGATLILDGIKKATSALLWEFEENGMSLPTAGSLSVLEDGNGQPVCVVKTTWTEIILFRKIDAEFAFDYGDGYRTLSGWRRLFWIYYFHECAKIGRKFSDNTPLVCERFHVVYR